MPAPSRQRTEVLKASIPDIRAFATLLRGICFSMASQRATMTINHTGIMISVEEARSLQGAACVARQVFDEFEYIPRQPNSTLGDEVEDALQQTVLDFQLNVLLECLNIFGTAFSSGPGVTTQRRQWKNPDEEDSENENAGDDGDTVEKRDKQSNGTRGLDFYFPKSEGKGTGMRLTYAGAGYPLVLHLAEDASGPTTTCELSTYDAEPQLDIPFENSVMRCILKSSWLRDALSEIDPSCEKLTFHGHPVEEGNRHVSSKPLLRIHADGVFGTTEMDYPNDKEVLETFECPSPVSFSYRFSHVAKTLKALQSSAKTSLRIDSEGVLSLQFLSFSPNPKAGNTIESFIDFRCLSIDEQV